MSMNNQGRPSGSGSAQDNELPTISGDRGLDLEARLIFEIGRGGVTGVDLRRDDEVDLRDSRGEARNLARQGDARRPAVDEGDRGVALALFVAGRIDQEAFDF